MPAPEPHDELEDLLADLPIREPSQMLDERINAFLCNPSSDTPPPRSARRRVLRFASVAALLLVAGTVAVVLVVLNQAHPDIGEVGSNTDDNPPAIVEQNADPEPDIVEAAYRFEPEPLRLEWSREISEETRTAPNGKPYTAVLREAIDQRTWYDPQTGTTMQVSTPRKEWVIRHQNPF